MPSIFIWKSVEPNISKATIRYYSGSNWFLEDNDGISQSFQFDSQEVICGSRLCDNVILFSAKEMKKDWVGTELLEVTQLPYKMIKSDEFGKLDMIGDWFRFISNSDTVNVEQIHDWMIQQQDKKRYTLDFDNFLIKYDTACNMSNTLSHNTNNKYKKHQKYHKYTNPRGSVKYGNLKAI